MFNEAKLLRPRLQRKKLRSKPRPIIVQAKAKTMVKDRTIKMTMVL